MRDREASGAREERRGRNLRRWTVAGAAVLLIGLAGAHLAWQRVSVYTLEFDDGIGNYYVRVTFKKWGKHAHREHGPFTQWWWEGGPLRMQGSMHNGEMDGVWTTWNDQGEVVRQQQWRRGALREEQATPPWWGGVEDQR